MVSLLKDLFTSSSSTSSSSSNSHCSKEMEQLCKTINDLANDIDQDAAGLKAADLTRKHRAFFEKNTEEIEAFLLHCNPAIASAAMMAAIKALFDASLAKNFEANMDRSVELLKHYLDNGQLVAAHVRLVPEIVFPLVRNIGFYCLERKNKPELGLNIVSSALNQIFPADYPNKHMTSAHCALLVCAVRLRSFQSALPFIHDDINGVIAEYDEERDKVQADWPGSSSSSSTTPSIPSPLAAQQRKQRVPPSTSSQPAQSLSQYLPVLVEGRWISQYLYYSSLVLIGANEMRRALILLETLVSIPTIVASDLQLEAYKKFLLVSLLVHGHTLSVDDKSPPVVRMLKSRVADYQQLTTIWFARGKNTADEVHVVLQKMHKILERDDNLELMQRIVAEMRYKSVIAVAKVYSSIFLTEVKKLANLADDAESLRIIQELVNLGRIKAQIDREKGIVEWEEVINKITKEEMQRKSEDVGRVRDLLEGKNNWLKTHPNILARQIRPLTFYNEDEGLSMGSSPIEC